MRSEVARFAQFSSSAGGTNTAVGVSHWYRHKFRSVKMRIHSIPQACPAVLSAFCYKAKGLPRAHLAG